MIKLKTKDEIAVMRQGGKILKKTINKLLDKAVTGVSTMSLNQKAEKLIKEYGALPSFKMVKNYQWATCLPINSQIVHTPPSEVILKPGDLLTIDIGVCYRSYHTDYATTIAVGGADETLKKFLKTGEETLTYAIKQVKHGNFIGNISQAINQNISKNGYFVVRQLTGHGIGRELHEEPLIPGYLDASSVDRTPKIKNGMVLAIEVIYALGSSQIVPEKGNNWSLTTKDGSLSACFEKTIAVIDDKPFSLT